MARREDSSPGKRGGGPCEAWWRGRPSQPLSLHPSTTRSGAVPLPAIAGEDLMMLPTISSLLGILIVVAGFALRLNPMLVVTVAALATGLIAGKGLVAGRLAAFGKAFNDNRFVTDRLDRAAGDRPARALRPAAARRATLIGGIKRRDRRAAAHPLSAVPPDHRRLGLTSIAGHRRPCGRWSRRWREAAAEQQDRGDRRGERARGEGLCRRHRQCRPVLRRGHLHRDRLDPADPSAFASRTAIGSSRSSSPSGRSRPRSLAFLIHSASAAAPRPRLRIRKAASGTSAPDRRPETMPTITLAGSTASPGDVRRLRRAQRRSTAATASGSAMPPSGG